MGNKSLVQCKKRVQLDFMRALALFFCCIKKAVVVKGKSTALAFQSCWNALDGSLANYTATANIDLLIGQGNMYKMTKRNT